MSPGAAPERLELRCFRPADADEVFGLHDVALRDAGAHAGHGPWDEDLRRVEEAYLRVGGEFLVGELGERIVAMRGLRPTTPGRAEIRRMRVHPDHQGRGFGSLLLAELERRASRRGLLALHLDTTEQQEAAQGFYRHHGYTEMGRERRGPFVLIYFEKALSPDDRRSGS